MPETATVPLGGAAGRSEGTKQWDLCFWEPSLSPHKLPLLSALQKHPEVASVRCIADRGLSEGRKQLGWSTESADDTDFIVAPSKQDVVRIFQEQAPGTVNIMSGLRWFPTIVAALASAREQGARYGIMSEPRASESLLGIVRWAHSWLTERPVRKTADFVLAIGRNGSPWFRKVGYSPERIFPFAYFLPPIAPVRKPAGGRVPSIGYLGRLTPEKGILHFLRGFAGIERACTGKIAGAGPCEDKVRQAAASSGGRLDFIGALPMAEIGEFLAGLDILVVPSQTTDDGWGAVIGEALMAGLPVITTAKAGASICLADPGNGIIIPSGNAEAISAAVEELLSSGLGSQETRIERSARAQRRLTDRVGAEYLIDILASVYLERAKPTPFYLLP